ncbi:MAG: L,D-transpeptidase, partial [Spirochaetia bacterium]|nr:L,D-transpeptidase [Spirochaetia bacterium]
MKLGRLRVFCTSCARRALRHPVGRLILLAWFLPAGILFGCSSPYNALLEAAFASSNGTQYAIVVDKKNYTVHVYNNARVLVASYPAGYGLNPDGGTKLHSGDNRTPEGLYHVNEIL